MKILCVILIFAFLLGGCSLLPRLDAPTPDHGNNFSSMGNMNIDISDGTYISGGDGVLGGIGTDKPVDDSEDDIDEAPPVNNQPETDPVLSGKWEYVDLFAGLYILTFQDHGWVDLEQCSSDENGTISCSFRLSCQPTIEDGRITFPGDTEFDPPTLVLQLEYVESVGYILDVVSSSGSFSTLTEYFHRVG